MNNKMSCPHCQQHLEIPEELFGQTVECPTCNKQFTLPMASTTIISEEIIVQRNADNNTSFAIEVFEKLLTSDNGKGNSAIFSWWINVIGAVIVLAMLAYAGNFIEDMQNYRVKRINEMEREKIEKSFGSAAAQVARGDFSFIVDVQNKTKRAENAISEAEQHFNSVKETALIVQGVAILCIMLSPMFGVLKHQSIAGTYIRVYERGIVGKGEGRGKHFRLVYSQVTSVDVSGSAIIVHASGAKYKCYVENPVEIQKMIDAQRLRAIADQYQKVDNQILGNYPFDL